MLKDLKQAIKSHKEARIVKKLVSPHRGVVMFSASPRRLFRIVNSPYGIREINMSHKSIKSPPIHVF